MKVCTKLSLLSASVVLSAARLFADANFEVTTNDTVVTVKAVDGSLPVLTEPFLAPDVTKVVFDATRPFKYNPSAASTYAGGTEIAKGQLYVCRDDAFGSGEVRIGTTAEAALMARDVEVSLPNKVVFCRSDSYAVGFGDSVGRLTLAAVGTNGRSPATVRFGRTGAGAVGRVTLALVGESSEAIDAIQITGALDLRIDGGVLSAGANAQSPFFAAVKTSGDVADVTVAPGGATFDVPDGVTLVPGVTFKIEETTRTNVVATCSPANPSFEDGEAGWTKEQLPGGESDSGVKSDPCAWNGQGTYKPDGAKFAMIRQGARLSTTVTIPDAGLWRVVFLRGGRPGGYSSDVKLTVALGDASTEYPASSVCDFVEVRTPPVRLEAGSQTLSFTTSNGGSGHSLNIDAVSLERVEEEVVRGAVKKTGLGTLSLDGQGFAGGALSVDAGTARLVDATFGGAAVSVADGATLSLSAYGDSLVANGSFEADGEKDYSSEAKPRLWSLKSGSGWGLQKNGGTLSASGPLTPAGVETLYLREGVSVGQTVSVAKAGRYRVSFLEGDREYATSEKVPVKLLIDGEVCLTVPARAEKGDYALHGVDVELTAGDHEIAFETGLAGSAVTLGNIVFIDDVRMREVRASDLVADACLRMAQGSTLDLDLSGRAEVASLLVDGAAFSGGRSALVRAGVSVTGDGRLRVGKAKGTCIVVR